MGVNPQRLTKVLRRIGLPLVVALTLLFWWNYGVIVVSKSMDTMPEDFPPGTWCVVDKRFDELEVGQVVFVELDGRRIISRVYSVYDGGIEIAHDNPRSRDGDGGQYGFLPRSAVIARVMTGFVGQRERPPEDLIK